MSTRPLFLGSLFLLGCGRDVVVLPNHDVRREFERLMIEEARVFLEDDTFAIDPALLPGDGAGRIERFVEALGGGSLRVWRFPVEMNEGNALMTERLGERFFVDLFDADGRWIDHGLGPFDGAQVQSIAWDLDDSDPTICACREDMAICTWVDGSEAPSGSIGCN